MTWFLRKSPSKAFRFRTRVLIGLILLLAFCAALILTGAWFQAATPHLLITLGLAGLPVAILISAWVTEPFHRAVRMLETGIHSIEDGEFGFRLAPTTQPELTELIRLFNRLPEVLSQERGTLYQKELLMDTVIQSAPMAILLVGPHDRILLANSAAQDMFRVDNRLIGMTLTQLTEKGPPAFREVLMDGKDTLFSLRRNEETETYHLAQREFRINTLPHLLVMVKHLSREIRRQEVATWKKLIRLINHELNNALSPLQSLLHSARKILLDTPEYPRLERILDTMEHSTRHLIKFLEDYATFARLPAPRKEDTDLRDFIGQIQSLMPFDLEDRLEVPEGFFDPAQMQQVLLNLLKNAREAGTPDQTVEVCLFNTSEGGFMVQIRDRGKGMSDEALQKALLPFYSTKKSGTGLGLSLCREILESHGGNLRIERRTGGGMIVSCWFPGK